MRFHAASPRRFLSVVLLAVLAVAVRAAPDNNGGFDHRAHAVPGGPYQVPDANGDGKALVTLNGELSHSHYFNTKTGATGKIIKYEWSVNGKKICGKMVCGVNFNLGKTFVKLHVVDNTGDSATASTFVYVFKGAKPGVRFWFYPGVGWIPDKTPLKPTFSSTVPMANLPGPNAFPIFLRPKKFSMRLLGSLDMFKSGNYRFRIGCSGGCTLWIAGRLIATGTNGNIDSNPIMFSKAVRNIAAVFRRNTVKGPAPKFTLSWQVPGSGGWAVIPAKFLSHTPATYMPVVHSVAPGRAAVGSVITISGSSLLNVKAVKVGGQFCAGPTSKSQFAVTCVVPGVSGPQRLSVVTAGGTSNTITLTVAGGGGNGNKFGVGGGGTGPVGYYQPISFSKSFLKKGGGLFKASQMTAITLGPDGKYYIGSLNGIVHVVGTDFGAGVTDYCKSANVGKSRSILGLAFNPAENTRLRLYVSTSVLYWGVKKLLPYTKGWHNGQIIAMQKTKNSCLTPVQTVISGLPVSNHDHTVNGLNFDHYGNLLISVGGTTNGGVSTKGDPLGGIPDSPLSGAVLLAPILKKGFNGKIAYSNYENPAIANKVNGDVFVHAAGLRNSFCNVAHSNGHLYATDNGANAKFGAKSNGCNKQGGISSEPDTLKKLRKGGFHGYANRNRGRKDPRQCIHRPPQSNMPGYDKHIATFESSTDGLVEYTANTFGAQMRGELLASKFAVSGAGKVFRIKLNPQGTVRSVFPLAAHSGLTVAMSPTGSLVMPRVYQGKVAVLLPNEKNPGRLVVTSVNPYRGPKRGGGIVTVTGWNLNPPLRATFGGRPCQNIGNFKKGRSFTCVVPPGSGRAPVVVTRLGKSSKSFGFEYIYLKV